MRILVTGSSGHLGEALVRTLRADGHDVIGADIVAGECTSAMGSIVDRAFARDCMRGRRVVFHAATLHKPHVATHPRQAFIDTNVTGTLNLLEASAAAGVESFIFTSTTSVFGDALIPPPGQPAAWITEDIVPVPKNIYGVTKSAAEDLCQLFNRNEGLPVIVLRTSRFFPEEDDSAAARAAFDQQNLKVNEFLYRRVEIADVVRAHRCAMERATQIGFGKYIISATTPFTMSDLPALRTDAPAVVRRLYPEYERDFAKRGWQMVPTIDRIYINARARRELGWQPRYDFATLLDAMRRGDELCSPLAQTIGSKGYHPPKSVR